MRDIDDRTENDTIIGRLKNNFSKIIRQANNDFQENPETEYILIIGQKLIKNENSYLKWYKFIFDTKGLSKGINS